jgi:hypothetical protein
MKDNTDGLLVWEPDDAFSPLEIWCGTPTLSESSRGLNSGIVEEWENFTCSTDLLI